VGEHPAAGHRRQGFVLKRAVEIRLASVSALLADAGSNAQGWLAECERARLDGIGSRRRRAQFIAGHWLARIVAAKATDSDPSDWSLTTATNGAPRLVRRGIGEGHGLDVSLTHSGDVVVAAVAPFALGIDVEASGRTRDWLALADLVFAPVECAQLQRVASREREALFLRCWTLREALGKRDGNGLRSATGESTPAREYDASEADAITWQSQNCYLAVVGESGMTINAEGIADTALKRFWRSGA
jgi:phosphopantetheinyl transferase